jgi:hypothetical protein
MKKIMIIILVVLLAAMAIVGPALADGSDSSHACNGLKNALSQMDKDDPALQVLLDLFNEHCGKADGGGSINACDGLNNALSQMDKGSPAFKVLLQQIIEHCKKGGPAA